MGIKPDLMDYHDYVSPIMTYMVNLVKQKAMAKSCNFIKISRVERSVQTGKPGPITTAPTEALSIPRNLIPLDIHSA